MDLKGKTALITGASGKLGSELALALARRGCQCICHFYRNETRARELEEQTEALNVRCRFVSADLARPEGVERLFERIGGLDTPTLLINSAAIFERQAIGQVNFEKAQKTFALNITAAILTSRAFAQRIAESFSELSMPVAKILNISDVGGIVPWAEYSLYCASKAGLIGATKSLAKELAPAICVNSLAPGVVSWPENFSAEQRQRQLGFIPMGRIADIEEIISGAMFLLENDYITGCVLQVDGGRAI
jgi:NAD(P)-dependent dehydrogenase (short-subunit alcohol dehydrogenase family)